MFLNLVSYVYHFAAAKLNDMVSGAISYNGPSHLGTHGD